MEEPMTTPGANTVAWFEIGTPDVDAAKAFYGSLFGWSFTPDGGYTLITAPGAQGPSGGIFGTAGHTPPYAVFVVKVADVAATAERAAELGGKVAVPPMTMDDGMAVAYLTDPDGSMFALFSPRPEG
jgi:predicted enzyme related to lactoylglutathione lyase